MGHVGRITKPKSENFQTLALFEKKVTLEAPSPFTQGHDVFSAV